MSIPLWAGLECTVNRVHDIYHNQMEKSCHDLRTSDLKLFSELSIKKIRYPCLWELTEKVEGEFDWISLDERLGEIKNLGLHPIAGFLHHGSGPPFTSLIDPSFPEKFARYAKAFASRYPWIKDFTPINEILTTARFSCLYGHWYPHHKCQKSFIRALYNQSKATILAMREIRKIIPDAQLIQTDDLGRAQGTNITQRQVDHENERRWLGWDFLIGKINPGHALFDYVAQELTPKEIDFLQKNACPPDILGINHYLLSSRFLDHNMDHYPAWSHGGNGEIAYADIGAVDTGEAQVPSPKSILLEAWYRYGLPIAITEVHTMGNRESQMRWLHEVYQDALSAKEEGVPVVAVTAWSLLGTYDWNKLCTTSDMFYEPGIFDLRTPDKKPRGTALSKMIKHLAESGAYEHPILDEPGWWKTPRRILWGAPYGMSSSWKKNHKRPIVITGGTGTLGQAFARICGDRNIPYTLISRKDVDLTEVALLLELLRSLNPWAVINTAGYVKVDHAEEDKERCFRENVSAAIGLASACDSLRIPAVHFSSDLVFNGEQEDYYLESHRVSPVNTYGSSKAECERILLERHPNNLIIRTSSFFGPWDQHNFVTLALKHLATHQNFSAINDTFITPTYVPDLVNATLDLLFDGERGIIHLVNEGRTTWSNFAKQAIRTGKKKYPNLSDKSLREYSVKELNLAALRPRNSALSSERYKLLPTHEDALERYFSQLEIKI
jgi:dTDP-4-dehydrorhamnose reductase